MREAGRAAAKGFRPAAAARHSKTGIPAGGFAHFGRAASGGEPWSRRAPLAVSQSPLLPVRTVNLVQNLFLRLFQVQPALFLMGTVALYRVCSTGSR